MKTSPSTTTAWEEVAAALGRALARYHGQVRARPGESRHASAFPGGLPWILTSHRTSLEWFQGFGPAGLQILQQTRQVAQAPQILDALCGRWQRTHLIHGDIKWENLLICPPDADRDDAHGAIRIIDWELADLGDPCWDVGGLLQSYLGFWLLSHPSQQAAAPSPNPWPAGIEAPEGASGAPDPTPAVLHPALRAFWKTYVQSLEIPESQVPWLAALCVQYAGARMIQTAYEYAVFAPQSSETARWMLQMALYLLTRPQDAGRDVLGLLGGETP